MNEPLTTRPDWASRLDASPLTALHCVAIGLSALALGCDLIEFALGNALSAVFSLHITAGRIGRIEAVYIDVPYGVPRVWRRDAD